MVSDKSRASGRVSGLYKSPYSRSLLEKGTARSEGKQRPTALSRCWNPMMGGHGHDFPLALSYQLRGEQHRAGISYPRVAPTKYCKGLGDWVWGTRRLF